MSVDPKRVQSVFLAAAEVAGPAARAAVLDAACGAEGELRRRVEALLKLHDEPASFLAEPPGGGGVSPEAAPTEAKAESRDGPGAVIGPYKLLQQIGEGGMGVVWMAEQQEPVRRKVALKVIKAGMDTRQVIARFEAERQALALMDHPHIAKVLDAGETASGRPYFVMELVKGVPLTRYCDEHRLTPRQRLELFVPVCQAIQHAHQKGVIHRDVKPSNVLVAPYDGQPVVKVIDFGVAKATGAKLTEKTLFTGFGALVGTLEYMAPEQAELNNQDIDTRSDIYSLGVLLYELLTGTTPLERKRVRESSLLEVLRLIREVEPPRPSTRLSLTTDELPAIAANRGLEPKKLSGLMRGELDWIVMKCLEKDRNRRYETANSLARDIGRYLRDEPVQACPPSAGYRLRKFVRRNQGPVLAAAVMVLLLVGGIIGTTLGLLRAVAEGNQKDQARLTAQRNLQKARQAVHDYFTLVSDQTLIDEPALEPFRKQLLHAALCYYQGFVQEYADDPELLVELAAAHLRIMILTMELGPAEDWIPPWQQCVDLMEEVLRRKPDAAAFECFGMGFYRVNAPMFFHVRRWEEAHRALSKAQPIWEELVRAYPAVPALKNDLAAIHLTLAAFHRRAGQHEEALRWARGASDLWRRLSQAYPDVPHYRAALAISLGNLSDSLIYVRPGPEAEESTREGLKVAHQLAADFPQVPAYRELLSGWFGMTHGGRLERAERLDEAAEVYREGAAGLESLRRERPTLHRYRWRLFGLRLRLGEVLWALNRPAEAAEEFRRLRALAELLSPEDPDAQDLLAQFLATCPDPQFRDARRAVHVAQKLVERVPESGVYWRTLGVAHYGAGDYQAAVRAHEKGIELRGRPLDGGFSLVMAEWQLGHKEQARKRYDRLIAEWEKSPHFVVIYRFRAEAEKLLEIRGSP